MGKGYPSREVTGTWIEKLEAETDEGLKSGFGYAYRCMMAMHDAIDAQRHDTDIAVNAGVKLAYELTQAKDLVRRLAAKVDEWEMGWVAYYGDPTDDIDPDSADLLAEAEAMTKGEQP